MANKYRLKTSKTTKITPLKKTVFYIASSITVIAIFFAGYLFGHQNLVYEKNHIRVVNTEVGKPKDLDFSVFWQVWNEVLKKYPGTVDQNKMYESAISGILTGLGDQYSEFLNDAQSKQLMEDLEGSFGGVGIEIAKKNNVITVVSALDNTPGQKAGIKSSDIIVKINDKSTENMSVTEAVSLIRGNVGTKVTLEIMREGFLEPKNFKLIRATIKVESVKWEMLSATKSASGEKNIAYIKISQFGADTEKLLNADSKEVLAKYPKGIILDLRDNPGGYLDSSISVASYWVKKGPIVFEESKGGKKKEYKSTGNSSLSQIPLVVLINGGSASASEIVAGAIQDNKLGILIGEKTFGKGSVQEVESLKNGYTLRLTVAKWLTPNGRYINSTGISPDIVVKLTEEDFNKGLDPQLDKALQLFK